MNPLTCKNFNVSLFL